MSRLLMNTVTYNRDLVPFGGVNCAIYLSTLLYHYREWTASEGWMLLNIELIQRITGLEPDEQHAARATLRDKGVLRDGMAFDEAAVWVDLNKLDEMNEGYSE